MLKPNSEVTTNLIKARELIADEKSWCQHSLHIAACHGQPERWCAVGSMVQTLGYDGYGWSTSREILLLSKAAAGFAVEENSFSPSQVNDQLGHAAVMKLFDRAIELSLEEE